VLMVAVPEQFRKVTECDSEEEQVGLHSKKKRLETNRLNSTAAFHI